MGREFRCVGLCPAAFGHAGSAIATSRAGGIGVLDLQFCPDAAAVDQSINSILETRTGDIGLRVSRSNLEQLRAFAQRMENSEFWLILADQYTVDFVLDRRAEFSHARILVEISNVAQLTWVGDAEDVSLIARGNEAGGWVGDDSTFILLQKLLRNQSRPVFVQGASGPHAAAAAWTAGAAGVILDDQLLLMPESDVPLGIRRQIELCSGTDTLLVGERVGAPLRVISRPGFAAADRLSELSKAAEADGWPEDEWRQKAEEHIGWANSNKTAWPIGQNLQIAKSLRDEFKTTGRLVQAMVSQGPRNLEIVRRERPLSAGSSLAQSHGLKYPIFQGPMTRVSDNAAFSQAVSRAGGMPFLALALMSGEQSLALLETAQTLNKGRPWGAGILGFIPKELRDKQTEAILKVKPPLAVIAGGRPDQAEVFEKEGIATYLHVPSPDLLKMFIDQGGRRFIFEGRECGGHVGPLGSFVLWEAQIRVLLEKITPSNAEEFHIVFAGGISDAASAALVASFAAPLVERGIRIGVLMGSAYLLTREIVETGAVVPEFQQQAVECKETISLESGPGHASRCAITPFAHEFYRVRRELLKAGASGDEIREKLEDLNLGRLRMASKGKDRKGADIIDIDKETQLSQGMYMIGQAATLCDDVRSVQDLHEEISLGATALLEDAQQREEAAAADPKPVDIAIIGIGTLLPKATSRHEYWKNILTKTNAITEIPKDRFDWTLYFDEDRKAKDKIYSKWGGFLDEIPFDPMKYGIPPNSLKSIDPLQLLTLEVVSQAIDDAGYSDGNYDRENTSIVLGASGGLGDIGLQYGVRAEMPRIVEGIVDTDFDRLPEWSEESFAGCLPNVAAGRVANRLDFGGLNFTIDAACASSLAALNVAVNELASGRSNIAIAGGIDTVQSPFSYMCFAKTSALSPTGEPRTFDETSDGIVISEGMAAVVLKRVDDAQRDGDRIYAVIKAVAGSSDGKALGLTAPLPAGQKRALNRAYEKAGFEPNTVGLIEAHGTGTAVGDRAEAETIVDSLKAFSTDPKSCAVGSVKTILGHTKGTAGIAGLIKLALSLHHKVLPPHHGVKQPIAPIADDESPVYLLDEPRPWLRPPSHPRRGGSSAFGFGGTNFHAVLEEYTDEYRADAQPAGADEWPCELFVFRGFDKADLERQIASVRDALNAGATMRLVDLAYSLALKADAVGQAPFAASVVADSLDALNRELSLILEDLHGTPRKTLPPYTSLSLGDGVQDGSIAFLFPGQGAQYPNMAREAAVYLPSLRAAIEDADQALNGRRSRLLSQYIYPPAAFNDETSNDQQKALTDTKVAQPAIGAISLGFADFANQIGLEASMMAGHSYGELTALHVAGCMSREDFFNLSSLRGEVMAQACDAETKGAMAVARGERDEIERIISQHPDLVIANHNSHEQTVFSGPSDAVEEYVGTLIRDGIKAQLLPVAGAFHSPLMAPIKSSLDDGINAVGFHQQNAVVYSNTTGGEYPADADEKKGILREHLLNSVEFVKQIENMYAAGARVFVELGPKSILSGLTSSILKDRAFLSVSFDGSGMRGVLSSVGKISVNTKATLTLAQLFEGRAVSELNLSRLAKVTIKQELTPTTWFLSGGCVRQQSDIERKSGRIPMLSSNDVEAAAKARKQAQQNGLNAAISNGHAYPNGNANGEADRLAGGDLSGQTNDHTNDHTNGHANGHVTASASNGSANGHADRQNGAAYSNGLVSNGKGMGHGFHGNGSSPLPLNQGLPANPMYTAAAAPSGAFDVVMAYQQTMRQFISVQEQIMTSYLSGGAGQNVPVNGAAFMPPPSMPLEALQVEPDASHATQPDATAHQIPAPQVPPLQIPVEQVPDTPSVNAPAISAPDPSKEPKSNGANLSRDALTALLLDQVSERTGYPSDMLGLDQDIEAELGIDSIKRVEILGALQEELPASLTAQFKEEMETLTRVKTLNGLIDHLMANAPSTSSGVQSTDMVRSQTTSSADAALSREALTALLLEQVSERTGYPSDMLGLDQDIEAELGIDSIKRVEILGALQEELPASLTAQFKEEMETLTRVKTLNGLIDHLMANAPSVSSEAPAVGASSAQSASSDDPELDREALTALLLDQVSERTGYPSDMLGLDQDIEAELGIDSIKRVEILGALQEELPASLTAQFKEEMETLTRVKTLNGLIDNLMTSASSSVGPKSANSDSADANGIDPNPLPETANRAAPEHLVRLPRYRMVAVQSDLDASTTLNISGSFIITQDELGVAKLVAQKLEDLGASCIILDSGILSDPGRVQEWIESRRTALENPSGIIHLASLRPASDQNDLAAWKDDAARDVKSFWALLNGLGEDLIRATIRANAWVIAASRIDGAFGRSEVSATSSPTAGGALGLVKTARAEWRDLNAKGIDFANDMSAQDIAASIIAEMRQPSDDVEIGYVSANDRYAFRTQVCAYNEGRQGIKIEPDWVVLITGGARGITAQIAEAIAVDGARFILAGRTRISDREDPTTAILSDVSSLRRGLLDAAKAAGQKPTPTEIERQVRRVMAEREIRDNIERLASLGVKVEYRAVDVSDEASFSGLINQLYTEYGRIDAVIHGAGVIEDRLIIDKTLESFDRVFDTKCVSAHILSTALRPDSLKFLAFFTSVAGRYGNRGQGDYAAANETLNRLAWQLHKQWSGVRVVGVNWGPWNSSGMVSDEVKRQFAKQGLEPIEIADGRQFFVDEMRFGHLGDVEVVAGVGPWGREALPDAVAAADQSKREHRSKLNGSANRATTKKPLFETRRLESKDGFLNFEHTVTLDFHQYLDDHRLDATPVMPAAAAAEWMAQIANDAWPDWRVSQISDLRVLKGLRLDGSAPKTVVFKARASSHADPSEMKATLMIGASDSPQNFYKCGVTLVSNERDDSDPSMMPLMNGDAVDVAEAYQKFLFHGPRFQLLRTIRRLDREGIDAEVVPSKPSQWLNGASESNYAVESDTRSWLFDPGLVDAALQSVLIWARKRLDITPLPASFGSLRRFDDRAIDEPLDLRCRIRPDATETKICFDAQFIDHSGKVRLSMNNIEVTGSKALNRLGGAG
ncbi:MAG: SDR family NAD(P)-dependent oxidoreductase [Pseudomonadota bacterium]